MTARIMPFTLMEVSVSYVVKLSVEAVRVAPVAVAVAGWLSVIVLVPTAVIVTITGTCAIGLFTSGISAPVTYWPTAKPSVLATATTLLPLVVLPVKLIVSGTE